MKKYIFLFVGVGLVGGGQIYIKNKAQYLEKQGYGVYVLYFHYHKEISIKYLERFKEGYFPDLGLNYLCLTYGRKKDNLNKMIEYIDFNNGDEVTIESNSVLVSLWGEELAKYTNGKHVIFSVSERNTVSDSLVKYLEFKYLRKELAAIKAEFFSELYKKSKVVPNNGVKKLIAFLGDPVEDYEEPIINNLELKEKNICILGRMEKNYVKYSCMELAQYIAKYPGVNFAITIIGTVDKTVAAQIKKMFQSYTNVNINILNAMHPIPKKIFSMFDLFIGGAGCASLPYRQGALTLCVDVNEGKPLGFMGYDVLTSFEKNTAAKEFGFYLDEALFCRTYEERKKETQKFTTQKECFSEHDNFIKNSEAKKEYFSFKNITAAPKEYIITFFRVTLGVKNYRRLHKLFTQTKDLMKKIVK